MSKVAPVQSSFNGGEIAERLRARIDQSLYRISATEMTGWIGLVEGAMEAMPGTIHVAQAPGPIRLFRFEISATQGHVIEASNNLFRIYTNDALLLDGSDVPVAVVSPYPFSAVPAIKTHQSFDVLYCFHRDYQTRRFVRTSPDTFAFELVEFNDGPFDDRNKDRDHRIAASALTGTVTLTASAALFVATDVGRLVKMEIEDFGDIPVWEPGVTVVVGDLRVSLERVYRAVSAGRTGTWQPAHTEGVEWDGMGTGTDINSNPAAGVQWEFVHDTFGIVKITAFTSATVVEGEVLRRLPFSTVSGNYEWEGGYYDPESGVYIPPSAITYNYGTWRWSLGAFSDTSGWPECGAVWLERLCLAKDSTIYGSVAGDFDSHAEINELGELSNDMAFIGTIPDPNPIVEVVAGERLQLFTANGCHVLGPDNAATGIGPRTLTISRCGTRIFETEFNLQRQLDTAIDLTRYARHICRPTVESLAVQYLPHNIVWGQRSDGNMVAASYLPEEEVLGMALRRMADGLAVRDIVSITDTAGRFDQVWMAAQFGGNWHVLRMAPWREDGEFDDTAVMVDMAFTYDGEPETDFAAPLLAGLAIEVMADGAWYSVTAAAGTGAFTIDKAASRVVAGLPYEAGFETLNIEAGGDNGPARHKMARVGRAWLEVIKSRGLWFGEPGNLQAMEQLDPAFFNDNALLPYTGFLPAIEQAGDHTRSPRLRVERRAPMQGTVAAVGCEIDVKGR
jgi:hypothetical protein